MPPNGVHAIGSSTDAERLADGGGSATAGPPGDKVRTLIIVAQDRPDLWARLTQDFSGVETVKVLLDRRRPVPTHDSERREADRRRPVSIETDLCYRQYVIVRAHGGRVPG
jgi:hypothetical protein